MAKDRAMECNCGELTKESHTNIQGYRVKSWKCPKCGEEYIDSSDAEYVLLAGKTQKIPIRVRIGVLGESFIIRIPREIVDLMHITRGNVVTITVAGRRDFLVSIEK
ncbi:MAG: AbrB/MazE/SpoVT family DNA-binding domain-containing protein [Methanomassiliicoccales archaeon]|nr:MAG: AbrB/MazE/SpoVT family DNA-binding domain-containing protein [Methanomassiliicoccales archaeon]